jgi:hypothetical protein
MGDLPKTNVGLIVIGDLPKEKEKSGLIVMSDNTTKRLMSSPKCRSVEVINNPARPGSNHREVNCINYS